MPDAPTSGSLIEQAPPIISPSSHVLVNNGAAINYQHTQLHGSMLPGFGQPQMSFLLVENEKKMCRIKAWEECENISNLCLGEFKEGEHRSSTEEIYCCSKYCSYTAF